MLKPLGMAGKTNTDQLLMDQIVDTVNDLINEMIKPVFEKDEARKVDSIALQITTRKRKRSLNYTLTDKQHDMHVTLLCMLCLNFFIHFDEEKKIKMSFD